MPKQNKSQDRSCRFPSFTKENWERGLGILRRKSLTGPIHLNLKMTHISKQSIRRKCTLYNLNLEIEFNIKTVLGASP